MKSRAARVSYTRDIAIQVGVNRKRQVNLFDPDGRPRRTDAGGACRSRYR